MFYIDVKNVSLSSSILAAYSIIELCCLDYLLSQIVKMVIALTLTQHIYEVVAI